jgi:malate synthase A
MIINALNSGASVFMADFEDANSPTWQNNLEGQINLRDTVNGTIDYTSPEGKQYRLAEHVATLLVRPRGWHLVEKHLLIEGKPVSASLFDFGLYFFHNAAKLMEKGTGPYFYLPKLESYLEAVGKRLMREALDRCEGVQTKAAELLHMSFRSFRYYAKKYALVRRDEIFEATDEEPAAEIEGL